MLILRRVWVTIVAVEKTVRITCSECVFVPLVIQHAMRMLHIKFIILPSVASPALQYSSTFSQKTARLSVKKVVERKMCLLISLQLLSATFPTLRTELDIINIHVFMQSTRCSCHTRILTNLEFSR